jgi:hypothetical protein
MIGAMMIRYGLPIIFGLVLLPEVGLMYFLYPLASLVGYFPLYESTGLIWALAVNIVCVIIFYLFAFRTIGFPAFIPAIISLITAVFTLPLFGTFQLFGIVINAILNLIPWELSVVFKFADKGSCDLPVTPAASGIASKPSFFSRLFKPKSAKLG